MSSITTGEVRDPKTGEPFKYPKPADVSYDPKCDPTSTYLDTDALVDMCKGMKYTSYNVLTNQLETTDYSSLTKDKIVEKKPY